MLVFNASGSPRQSAPDFGPAGIAYADRGARRNPGIATTRPEPGDPRFTAVAAILKDKLPLRSDEEARAATSILLEELEAPAPARATRSVATPLTIGAALLQDRRGVTGKNNPANIALILEQMYSLGGGSVSVSHKWASAILSARQSGLPTWASEAIMEIVPTCFRENARQRVRGLEDVEPAKHRKPAWLLRYQRTPFGWFSVTWDRLCTEGWIDKMPRRRWADWAACVARTAIATGYMFEMHMARRMTAALVSKEDPDTAVRSALDDSNRLFTWDDHLGRVAADVGPTMNRLAAVGTECLALLEALVEDGDGDEGVPAPSKYDGHPNGLCEWLVQARRVIASDIDDVQEQISHALDARRSSSANNIWETMRYSLLDRSESGADDLYALLRGAGRYTWSNRAKNGSLRSPAYRLQGPDSYLA